ncbi:MAG: spermidine synthase [Pseudoalteromonas tetraodonis]|jgi:spermidine synthase
MSKHNQPDPEPSAKPDASFWLVSLCFFLSGMAGLIYQMVWMRYLSTVFGTSELAIVAVLVAYMGGLAAGAWAASKLLHKLRRPIITYAVLELAIAVSAIAVPLLLRFAGLIHTGLLGGQAELPADGGLVEAIAHLALGCLVLFIPTACMGATLPILAKGLIHRSSQIGRRIGWLYALNTFGAVAGTITAAFFLIPTLGLWRASFFGVALNILVAALGWSVARKAGDASSAETEATEKSDPPGVAALAILVVMLVSGALSFVYEVLWARLLAHVLGGSFYSFATMLAAFLAGIAIGGLIGARLARDWRRSCLWLAGFEIGIAVLSAIILAVVSGGNLNSGGSLFGQAMMCALILTPATICLGATFPLAVRCLSARAQDAGPAAGRVYAWNTVGAIAGAIVAGLIVIPLIGYAATFKWAITANLLLAAGVLAAARSTAPRPALIVAAVACLASAVLYHPKPPVGLLTRSPLEKGEQADASLRLIHYATGRSATVAVLERRGSLVIRSNGLQEAEIFPRGAETLAYTHIRWLPALPKVLKPDAESLLVVGFGGGALLESVPRGFETIDVVEIEQEVITANQLVADRRAIDPLADDRLNIIINDARGALKLTDKRYDAIVSQPSHPWTAGASHLYTQEFLELSAEHMNPGGIFVQWLGANFVDETLLGSFCAAALEVFPHLQLYLISDNFVVVGSDQALDERLWNPEFQDLILLSDYPKLSYIEDLLAVLQLDEAGCRQLAAGHAPITDDRNLMATHHLPGKEFEGALNQPDNLVRVIGPLHFLNRDPTQVRAKLQENRIDLRYLTRLLKSGSPALNQKQFYGQVLTEGDRFLIRAAPLVDRQPDQATDLLSKASDLGSKEPSLLPLSALAKLNYALGSWKSRKGTPPPREFAEFVAENQDLAADLKKLPPLENRLVEVRYWAATDQSVRVREAESDLAKFTDHRTAWFEPAYQMRLTNLLNPNGKSQDQVETDLRAAVEYLDELLALPLERNLPLVQQRIALAQKFDDVELLSSMAWIITRKLQRLPSKAPAATRSTFTKLLGSLFAPYAVSTSNGRPRFSNSKMADLYSELHDELGGAAFSLGTE